MTGPIFDTHAHYSAHAFDADRFALLDSLPGLGGGLGQSCLDHQSRDLYAAVPIVRIR